MAARRCPKCSINYPSGMLHLKCAACGIPNVFEGKAEPDKDWSKKVEKAQKKAQKAALESANKKIEKQKAAQKAAAQAEIEGERHYEARDVISWRFSELVRAGYDPRSAKKIAHRYSGIDRVDLEEARSLVKGGCPPEVAADILL